MGAADGMKGAKVGAVVAGAMKEGGAVEGAKVGAAVCWTLKSGAVVAGAIKTGGGAVVGADQAGAGGAVVIATGGNVTGSKTTDGTVTAGGMTSTRI